MGIGLGLGIQFYKKAGARLSEFLTWGQSVPTRFWGDETPEYWGGIDPQAQIHYDRVIADGGVLPSGLGGVNSFFQVVKEIYGTSDINSVISAAYDPQVLGYKLGAGSGTTLGQAAQKLYSVKSTENLLFPSEDFANASWVKIGVTITSNSTIAPDGVLTADTFNGAAASYLSNNLLALTPQSYTTSIYVKKLATSSISIEFQYHQSGSDNTLVTFNFDTGVISGGTVETLANGWFRIRAITNITANRNQLRIVSSDSFYIWGIQLNTGSVALPYTQTTTTAETLADVVQTTAASQPLLLVHSGQNYWFGSGIDGNFVSTPNRTPAGSTQLDVRVKFEGGNLNANRTFFSQSGAGGGETDIFILRFANASTGTINMLFGAGLALSQTSSVGIGAIANYMGWIRVTYSSNGTNADVTFFSSTDGSSWTQLSTHTVVSARLGNQNSPYQIGSNIGFNPFQGKISRATASNSIGGAPVVDFNPNQYNPSTSQTQWASSTGEVWSLNVGTAATGYKGQLVTKATMQSDGIDDRMITSSYTSLSSWTNYFAYSGYTGNNAGRLIDDIAAFQRNDLVLNTSSIAAFNGGLTIASRIVNNKSFLVTQKTTSNSSLGYQNTNTPTVNLNDARAYTFSGISLFSAQNGAGFGNASLDTLLISKQADNSTQRTGVYNYVRSLNGAAF